MPALINTLPLRTKLQGGDHMIFRIFRSLENQKRLDTVSHIFGMSNVVSDIDIQTGTRYITVLLYNPLFSSEEKKIIASILYSLFKDELENLYCSYSLGYSPAFSLKHYYDFEAKEFSYTEDLFDHYFRFIMKTFDSSNENIIPAKKRIPYQSMYKIWDQDYDVTEFVRKVNRRAADEKVEEFGIHADPLSQFQSNLLDCLLDTDKYRKQKSADFFKNYIKSIKFIPAFNKFGFGQYYIYIHPADLNKIDFKLLFLNSFQSVRHAVKLDTSLSFLMKYVMPYENPNLAYLNRITKSDKIIQEYCLFSIKKVHYIFQFYYNLTPEGWVYDKNKFKKYMQNILFNPSYDVHIPKMTTYELSKAPSVYGPDSSEYEVLTRIYTTRSLDIKSYLGTSRRSYIEDITTLLKNGCIFPYLSLTHLDLHNIIRIIIPNIPEESKETIIKIFSYFNYGFIYEIEGKYFIHGLPEEVSFEEGLFLKLYFPLCTLYEFFTLFKQLFEYLNVPHYLILTDFCKGDILLENVYGDKDALKSYNPLKNLIWNEKDKKWMNHKLYTEKFEPIYPDLFYNEIDHFQ